MKMKYTLALGMGVTLRFAIAAPGPPAEFRDLSTKPRSAKSPGRDPRRVSDFFKVIAATPILSAEINRRVAESAKVDGLNNDTTHDQTSCDVGLMTDLFVSWVCRSIGYADGPGGGGGYAGVSASAYLIKGTELRAATPTAIFAPRKDLAAALAKFKGQRSGSDCTVEKPLDASLYVSVDGIEFISDTGVTHGCLLEWDTLKPLLPANSVFLRMADRERTPKYISRASWTGDNAPFVLEKDGVRDRVTGLLWAAHDSGADLTWDEAVKYAAAYRGGGYDNWRLPTQDELASLADLELAHKERGDCTGGSKFLELTPLVHLSCGLLWSSSAPDSQHAVAFGFISGTPRISLRTEKKNFRALVVRN